MAFTKYKNNKQEKSKLKTCISIHTVKIINDLDINKPSSGEIPIYVFEKCDFVLDTVKVCAKEAWKTESFLSMIAWNVKMLHQYTKSEPFW